MNTNSIKIEKGIPIPNIGSQTKYPFSQLEIGDSFFVDVETSQKINPYERSKALKRKFIRRKEGSGMRIWRIE